MVDSSCPNLPRRSMFAAWHWPNWVWCVIVPLLLVSYPLSIGPFAWLADRGYLPNECLDAADVIYSPVGYACSQSDMATEMFDWYCDLWSLPPEP